ATARRSHGRPGVSDSAPLGPTEPTREGGRSLRLLGDPGERAPGSGTPAGPGCQAVAASGHGPSARSDGGRAARSLLAGLDRTACAPAVDASAAGSPPPTPDALPAAGQALAGGIGYPQHPSERFPRCFLLSQPIRTQERPSSAAGRLERSHATKRRSAGP